MLFASKKMKIVVLFRHFCDHRNEIIKMLICRLSGSVVVISTVSFVVVCCCY